MAKNKSEDSSVVDAKNPSVKAAVNTVKISDVVAVALKNWYWVLLCLAVCVFYGWYIIAKTAPMYKQSMSVLLRDDVQGNGTGSSSINLGELGLTQTYTILEDEMEALRSPDLIEQVVVALNLSTIYTTPSGLHQNTL